MNDVVVGDTPTRASFQRLQSRTIVATSIHTAVFGRDHPAPSVHALLDHLRSQHCDGDVYRGQTEERPTLIPSMHRKGAVSNEAGQKIVSVDQDRIYASLQGPRHGIRQMLLAEMIRHLGVALGNIIAQQYGLTSECVDVTEDPRVAAFFATRRWPTYAHEPGPGIGVVYRFRGAGTPAQGDTLTHLLLDGWFEMGEWEGKYFETLVHRSDYDQEALDRDKWLGLTPPRRAVVSTLPLRMRWSQVHGLAGSDDSKAAGTLWRYVSKYEHRLTRTSRQRGGFIRPRFHWESDIPSRHGLHPPAPNRFAPCIFEAIPGFNREAPRVMPSSAIKVRLVGVENLLLRDDCEAFYFRHGTGRVTGFYRRDLWPDPSEDPLFSLLWSKSNLMMSFVPDFRAVEADDPDDGILDRGYRVDGERQTMHAHGLDDVTLGQLEDAQENIAHGNATAKDWTYLSGAMFHLGQMRRALAATIKAVRLDPDGVEANRSLAGALWNLNKSRWARRILLRLEALSPSHPDVQFDLAAQDLQCGDCVPALKRLKAVFKVLNPAEHGTSRLEFLELLVECAEAADDRPTAAVVRRALERHHRHGGAVVDVVEIPD